VNETLIAVVGSPHAAYLPPTITADGARKGYGASTMKFAVASTIKLPAAMIRKQNATIRQHGYRPSKANDTCGGRAISPCLGEGAEDEGEEEERCDTGGGYVAGVLLFAVPSLEIVADETSDSVRQVKIVMIISFVKYIYKHKYINIYKYIIK